MNNNEERKRIRNIKVEKTDVWRFCILVYELEKCYQNLKMKKQGKRIQFSIFF